MNLIKTITYKLNKQKLSDFAATHGLEMQIWDRGKNCSYERYSANFAECEVVHGGVLSSESGQGYTIREAIKDYKKRISGKLLNLGGFTQRTRVYAPELI